MGLGVEGAMRRTCLAFALLLVIPIAAAPAGAAELTTVGDGEVRELDCVYEVHLDGVVGRVTETHRFEGTAGAAEAVYAFALPAGAAVVGLTVTPPGGDPQAGAAVDAAGAITAAADKDTVAIAPDLGLVRRLGALEAGGDVAYELRAYPVGDGEATVVAIRWVVPLDYVDGRLGLRIPARGDGDALGAARGAARATAPAGVVAVRDLHAAGALLAAKPGKKGHAFTVKDGGEVRVEVTPALKGPVALFAAASQGDGAGTLAVAVLRPRAAEAPSRFERVVFVVDVSTSVAAEAPARDAMATLVGAIAGGVRDDAEGQVVLFDRAPAAALDGFTRIGTARTRIEAAIRDATPRGGSDLEAALAEVHRRLEASDEEGQTLVVVVSDGVFSSETTGATLAAALEETPDDVTVSAVLVAPDDAALPDPRAGALAELVRAHGGHAIAVRHGEAAARAKTIADEVGAAADWYVQEIAGGSAELALAIPDTIPAGGGFVSVGWYRGAAPKKVAVRASAKTLPAKAIALPGAGALAVASGTDPLLPAGAVGTGGLDRALTALARDVGVVGVHTALVAVDRTDELAAARLDLGARGGTFARIPPPPEAGIPVPEARVEDVVAAESRFEMDTAARIRVDLLAPQLLPAAKQCHREVLGQGGVATGTVQLEIEIARGEVIAVRASGATGTGREAVRTCLREAAFALTVPSYTLTDGPDTIHVIRYPVIYKSAEVAVSDDAIGPIDVSIDTETPLGDLTD
jgi:Mg-chelatase subunit ChlD